MQEFFLGIEVGGSKLPIVLGDESARICRRWRLDVDADKGGGGIRKQIESTLAEIKGTTVLKGVGVGFGGPVDWKTGRVCCSHQVQGWSDFELETWLRRISGAPVRVDNDANTAALGEALHGIGRGANPVFYVTLGSGVGGGLCADGKIYHGAPPGEAEIGHLRLNREGATIESSCSGWSVDRKIRDAIAQNPASLLKDLVGNATRGEAKFLGAALAQSDPDALRILGTTAEDLAFGLSHVVHLFHPEIIVIGGGLSFLGEPLRKTVEAALPRFVMEAFHPPPRIALASLREDAVPTGALELARLASSN